MSKDLRGTWKQALVTFFAPILLLFIVRWAVFEPYVIPSGSMLPNLWINDHVFVNKWAYGLRLPFSESWLHFWKKPERGDIVVFKYPVDKKIYFVKRIVAVERDEVAVRGGQIFINGDPIDRSPIGRELSPLAVEGVSYFEEKMGSSVFVSQSTDLADTEDYSSFVVPEGHFFVVGDNRDQSHDSRYWGPVPYENLMGRASLIWLSCESTLASASFVCDPASIRWSRLFKWVHN